MNFLRQNLWLAVATVVSLFIYVSSAGNFFLYDSEVAIAENLAIQIDGTELESWRIAALSTDSGPLGRPLAMLSFAANYALDPQVTARGIRLTNIALHCLIGWLIFLLLDRLLSGAVGLRASRQQLHRIALLAAVIWMLHPLHVSSVLYSVQRMVQLATLFTLMGVYTYVVYRIRWREQAPNPGDYSRLALFIFLFTVLGAFCKENGLLLPWLLAVVELVFFRFQTARGTDWLLRKMVYAAFLLPPLLLVCWTVYSPSWLNDWYAFRDFNLEERLLTQPRVLWNYFFQLILPNIATMTLHHDYLALSRGLLNPATTLLSVSAGAILLAVACMRRTAWPIFSFAVLWYLVGHAMESSFVPLLMAFEHRNYLPSIGIFLWIAAVLVRSTEDVALVQRLVMPALVLILSLLLILRTLPWRDELSLAAIQYHRHPDSAAAAFMLATTHYNRALAESDKSRAQDHFASADRMHQEVLLLEPDFVPSMVALLYLYQHSGKADESSELFGEISRVLSTPPVSQPALRYLPILTECVAQGECGVDPADHHLLLLQLADNQRTTAVAHDLMIRLCLLSEDRDCAETAIRNALEAVPDSNLALRAQLTLQLEAGDKGAALEGVRQMMAYDPQRRNLSAVRKFLGDE